HTVTTNLANIKNVLKDIEELTDDKRDSVATKIDGMLNYFDGLPKGRKWRARAKMGTTTKWYRPVETTQTVGEFGFFSGKHLIEKPKPEE
ncbi:MAG: hypothetical protein ACFFD4_34810, partial [Candidatus Odinarchaeota archaeon]